MLCYLFFCVLLVLEEISLLPTCGGNKECSRKRLSQALVDFTRRFWKVKAAGLVAWRIENSGGGEAF